MTSHNDADVTSTPIDLEPHSEAHDTHHDNNSKGKGGAIAAIVIIGVVVLGLFAA